MESDSVDVVPYVKKVLSKRNIDKPVKFVGSGKEFWRESKGEHSLLVRSLVRLQAPAFFRGSNAAVLRGKKKHILLGTGKMNKNVLEHELGHLSKTTRAKPKFWDKLRKGKMILEEERAWQEAHKFVKKKPGDELALSTYVKARHAGKAMSSAIISAGLQSSKI